MCSVGAEVLQYKYMCSAVQLCVCSAGAKVVQCRCVCSVVLCKCVCSAGVGAVCAVQVWV